MATLRMYGTAPESIVDGPGLRFSVFVQGCSHHCPGCHNPESQPAYGGYMVEVDDLIEEIHQNKLIHGVTLTGGEPFEQAESVLDLARALKGEDYDLWIYSGYLFEDLLAGHPDRFAPQLLRVCDVLVDGPFIQELNSYDLRWKGSSNQRIIDLKATFACGEDGGEVVLWNPSDLGFEKPDSW